jgi:hypothetical protein
MGPTIRTEHSLLLFSCFCRTRSKRDYSRWDISSFRPSVLNSLISHNRQFDRGRVTPFALRHTPEVGLKWPGALSAYALINWDDQSTAKLSLVNQMDLQRV